MHFRFGKASLIGLLAASGPNLPSAIILCLKVNAPNIVIRSSSLFYVTPTPKPFKVTKMYLGFESIINSYSVFQWPKALKLS